MSSQKQTANDEGLSCHTCGYRHLPVLYARRGLRMIRRVRECRHCGRRITTRERV
ncbi:MAG: hypothetical protein KAS72_12940 [Phycisphaerales bacterium]|nr:hypothetical protein [Phycisphaerales bacterium]